MSIWINGKKFDETSFPEEEEFSSKLNMEDIANSDQMHAKRIYKHLKIKKKLGEYHNLYLENDTLLLADVLKKFTKMCLKIY